MLHENAIKIISFFSFLKNTKFNHLIIEKTPKQKHLWSTNTLKKIYQIKK